MAFAVFGPGLAATLHALPSPALAAGAYDMRSMMAQPYPFSLQRSATMFQRPGQTTAPAPAPTPVRPPVGRAAPLAPGAIDPYTPATALISRGSGAVYRPVPIPSQAGRAVSATTVRPAAATTTYVANESSDSSGGFWDNGIWRIEGQNEDRGFLEGHMGNSHSGHLTWGWRVSFTPDKPNPEWFQSLRNWVGWPGDGWRAKASYALEQIAYTPNTFQRDNGLLDRPYAGALLASTRINLTKPFDGALQQSDTLEMGVGLVGQASGAEVVHRVVHSAIGKSSRAFTNQVKSEPVVLLQYEKGLRAVYEWNKWFGVELNPYAGAAVGNLYTYGAAGAIIRIGSNLKRDAGAPRTRYLMSGETFPERGNYWVWNLFAGAEQKAVGFNIFTDGNTYKDTSDVETKPFVHEFTTGGEIGYGPYRFTVMHVYRSEEFEEQTGQDRFLRAAFSAKF